MELEYCYHTHTKRCGHASGEDEEYVLTAIDKGIKRLGFSDHVMFKAPFHQDGIRGRYEEDFESYINSINSLKEQYKDKIDITVGYEAEYYPEMEDYYRSLLKEGKIKYLILGQHCYLNNGVFTWYFWDQCPIERVKKYVDDVIKAIKTGLFAYIAHPDTFVTPYYTWTKELEEESIRLLKVVEEYKIPLEINLYGHNKPGKLDYPCKEFWDLVKKFDIEIVFGFDAHKPFDQLNEEKIEAGIKFTKDNQLKVNYDFHIK